MLKSGIPEARAVMTLKSNTGFTDYTTLGRKLSLAKNTSILKKRYNSPMAQKTSEIGGFNKTEVKRIKTVALKGTIS
jgi:hypothetical protein